MQKILEMDKQNKKIEQILREKYQNISLLRVNSHENTCNGGQINIVMICEDFQGTSLQDRYRQVTEILEDHDIKYHEIKTQLFTEEQAAKLNIS